MPNDREKLGEMLGRAETQARSDAETIRSMDRVSKALLYLALAALLAAGVTTIYGIWNHWDAPIREAAGGYVSKAGETRTREQYESYVAWSRAMFITYPAAIGLFFIFGLRMKYAGRSGNRAKPDA